MLRPSRLIDKVVALVPPPQANVRIAPQDGVVSELMTPVMVIGPLDSALTEPRTPNSGDQ